MKDKSSCATPKLIKFLNRLFDLKRSGAAIFQRDQNTVIVTDLYSLSIEHLKTIEANFPHVSITVVSSESSRSGLLVIFSCGGFEQDHAWRRSVLRLCLHISLFFVILYLSILKKWVANSNTSKLRVP
jgi:hypothetical protein